MTLRGLWARLWSQLSRRSHLVMVVPALALYVTFVLYPIAQGVVYSLYESSGFGLTKFVGLYNYRRILTVPPLSTAFFNALGNNVVLFLVNTGTKLLLATCLAVLIYRCQRGGGFYKAVYFIPVTLSTVVVGYLWGLLLNPAWGPINQALRQLGLGTLARPWLGDMDIALYVVAMVGVWKNLGFFTLIVLAGLLAIPEDSYEAARIDGASGLRLHRHITIPLLYPTFLVLIVLNFIGSFEAFDLVYALTGPEGGPYYSTDVLGAFFYRTAFQSFGGFGLGAAIATLTFLIVFPVSAALNHFRRRLQEGI